MAYNKKKVLQTWDVGRNTPMTASRGKGCPRGLRVNFVSALQREMVNLGVLRQGVCTNDGRRQYYGIWFGEQS